MVKVFLGPAGVPISSKDHSTFGGIQRVAELELNAFECEFVRGVAMGNETAKGVGAVAKKLNVVLSVHCPYFINLCSADKIKLEASKKRILDSVERAHFMGANIAVFHPGYYGSISPEKAFATIVQACGDMLDRMKSKGTKDVKLGLETTGKLSQFGTLDENSAVHKELRDCVPVVDFAHIYARQGGEIDYEKVLDKMEALKLEHYHTHFTSMDWTPAKTPGQGNERRHLVLEANKPPFEPLARELMKRKISVTIISESPVLEQDSLVMKRIFEEFGYKW